ncbi:MAG: response regulator transcription factor, partial [Myxococcales bacterium]|nr:response regulator transcription factor [Myxococcales bacterium]
MGESILLVEDDHDIAEAARDALAEAGFEVTVESDGEAALERLSSAAPSLIVLDLQLRSVRGPEILRRVRRQAETERLPVIALSSRRDEIDRILAFELGADDFLGKPLSTRELALRARAVLRRSRCGSTSRPPSSLVLGPLEIDTERKKVRVEGQEVRLTQVEMRLLHDLAARVGTVQRREQLLQRVWPDAHLGVRTVDTHIRRLREKLGPAAEVIETIRGVGYCL